jgi:hypothetical protein
MSSETYKDTMDQLLLLIRAGYPVIYIVSHEESRVLDCLARIHSVILSDQPQKKLWRWCQGVGLTEIQGINPVSLPLGPEGWLSAPGLSGTRESPPISKSAPEALTTIRTATQANFAAMSNSVTVFFDIHPFLTKTSDLGLGGEYVRPLRNAADALRRYFDNQRNSGNLASKTIVIVAPSDLNISQELDQDMIRISFPLPEHNELIRAIQTKIDSRQLAFPDPIPEDEIDELSKGGQKLSLEGYRNMLCGLIASAGRGLTLEDFRLGLNKIAARNQLLNSSHVRDMLDLKSKVISNRALTYTPNVKIELGGLEKMKEWIAIRCAAAVSEEIRSKFQLPAPRGVMLCGASGGGKSQLAKLIAKEFKLALLRLDIGSLFGQYLGESEQRAREALNMAEVLAPVVLWIDEIDKAFHGIGTGGDGGVAARVFGYFLTWLSEKKDHVFVVTTANDFKNLLDRFPEFGRKGRFDQIFWVSLPRQEARAEIFSIYLKEAFQSGYLILDDASVDAIAAYKHITGVNGTTPLERLCHVLAHSGYSENLTGAEIEYLVSAAKYAVYSQASAGGPTQLTPRDLAQATEEAAGRALYRAGSTDHSALMSLEAIASANGWPFVS